jgi:hypothetical protein
VVINVSEEAAIFIFRDETAGFFKTFVTPYKTILHPSRRPQYKPSLPSKLAFHVYQFVLVSFVLETTFKIP